MTEPPLFTVAVISIGEPMSELSNKYRDHHAMGVVPLVILADSHAKNVFTVGFDGLLRRLTGSTSIICSVRSTDAFTLSCEAMPRPSGRPAWFAWWYICIAAGFVLLAVRQILIGGLLTGIVVRIVIALGFAALAYSEMRRNVG